MRAIAEGLSAGCRESYDPSVVQSGCREGQHKHGGGITVGTEWCRTFKTSDIPSKVALQENVKVFLQQCSCVLQRYLKVRGLSSPEGCRPLLIQALRVVSMDYKWEDHELLESSQIISPLSSLVCDKDQQVASTAFEGMLGLYRAVKAEAGTADPTPFQAAFRRSIHLMLKNISLALSEKQSAVTMLDDLTFSLDVDVAGLVVPHFPVGARLSLWLWVLFSSVEGSDIDHSANSAANRLSKWYLTV